MSTNSQHGKPFLIKQLSGYILQMTVSPKSTELGSTDDKFTQTFENTVQRSQRFGLEGEGSEGNWGRPTAYCDTPSDVTPTSAQGKPPGLAGFRENTEPSTSAFTWRERGPSEGRTSIPDPILH